MNTSTKNTFNNSIVILYTELAGYTISCLEYLANETNIQIHIINYPVNKEAPFTFNTQCQNITFYSRLDYNKENTISLIHKIKPKLIYCAGWSDKMYLNVIKNTYKNYPTLLGFDNQWIGNIKQQLSSVYARFKITPYFKYAFIPGNTQEKFALKIGFKKNQILKGAYSANTLHFNKIFNNNFKTKTTNFPKRFLYVGRYYEFKGIKELWQAFIELQNEEPNEWELWCLGIGDIEPIKHPKIKHFGFVQPKDLERYTAQTGVFILPSRFEPWGVVVHEFAASGFPLLLSDAVGAKEAFLEEGKNGYCFKSQNVTEIKSSLKKIMLKSDTELLKMGEHSTILAQKISPKTWAKSLIDILEKE